MKGDFSRDTYDSDKKFTRVLMQQGRVQLDADWNEQASILLHYLQSLAADLIGRHGGPRDNLGFKIGPGTERNFSISAGHYYVDGLMCDNSNEELTYKFQPDYPEAEDLENGSSYLVYLHAWERHITHLQSDHPIREVALNGPDTATRARLVCQVKWSDKFVSCAADGTVTETEDISSLIPDNVRKDWDCWIGHNGWGIKQRGLLEARVGDGDNKDDPCVISPDSRYRGLENQLYRVEIHEGGAAADATFKFSRDNGSVIFPLAQEVNGTKIFLEHLGRDDRFGLQKGDWVEIVDDDYALKEKADPLLKVESVDPVDRTVTLTSEPVHPVGRFMDKHPILRRWDHKGAVEVPDLKVEEGGLTLKEGAAHIVTPGESERGWLKLEDGIQVRFPAADPAFDYRTGDFWLIPARTATGDIEWPETVVPDPSDLAKEITVPESLPPRGINHHYAPLAIITLNGANLEAAGIKSCQLQFKEMVDPA